MLIRLVTRLQAKSYRFAACWSAARIVFIITQNHCYARVDVGVFNLTPSPPFLFAVCQRNCLRRSLGPGVGRYAKMTT